MPVERIGKLRESLTVNSEEYKKKFLRYLTGRQYYTVKASSEVEAIFPDVIITTRKGDRSEYWIEIKATEISLGDSDFLSQLAKYLAEYLSRTPENRFKFIIACYRLIDAGHFDKVFSHFDSQAIADLVGKMLIVSDGRTKAVIQGARPEEIKKFFEETTIKEADLKGLDFAEAKVTPTPPARPSIAETEYATAIIAKFGDIMPLKETDRLYLNLFQLDLPGTIYTAETKYKSSLDIFAEKPMTYPPFELNSGKIISFNIFDSQNPLTDCIETQTVKSIDLAEFVSEESGAYITTVIINRWISRRCRKIGLLFDKRTKTYFYPRKFTGNGVVTASWKPKERYSVREITRPMISDGKINFWIHRGAKVFSTLFSNQFYVQIKPRFLFSLDGLDIMRGSDADKKDRKFRKFNRNANQLYDARFWCRHVFPETEYLGITSLTSYIEKEPIKPIKILGQASIDCQYKPNQDQSIDVEALDSIDISLEELNKLDEYIG